MVVFVLPDRLPKHSPLPTHDFRLQAGQTHPGPLEANLFTGKAIIDVDERIWIAREEAKRAARGKGVGRGGVYRNNVGLLF